MAVFYGDQWSILEIKLVHPQDGRDTTVAEGLQQIIRYRDQFDRNAPCCLVGALDAPGMIPYRPQDMSSDRIRSMIGKIPLPCCTLAVPPDEEKLFVEMARAIGNPIRFEIVRYLATHPGCITGDIVKALPIAQATTSQHLKVLRDTGWVSGIVSGPATCYCLNNERVRKFKEIVAAF